MHVDGDVKHQTINHLINQSIVQSLTSEFAGIRDKETFKICLCATHIQFWPYICSMAIMQETYLGFKGTIFYHSVWDTKMTNDKSICNIRLTGIQLMSQLMRLWYLSHRRPAKAQASLRIRAVSLEPSLFARIKYGSRQRVLQKFRDLAPLDGCICVFEDWVYGGRKVPKSHELARILWIPSCLTLCLTV